MIDQTVISEAHNRIFSFIKKTPVVTSSYLDEALNCKIFFKCENLQHVGAFKARGAMNAALQIKEDKIKNGIATHSSGNHAQAVARAAKALNTTAYIVMPHSAISIKKQGVQEYGGHIIECEPTLESREKTLREVIAKTGAHEIHPFNDYAVIAGQATVAKELIEECPDLDYIITPVGGGGLLSGTILSAKFFSPHTKVVAGEPEGADDAYRAMKSGKIEKSQASSIADGLLTSLGNKTFPIIRDGVELVITVSDLEIAGAALQLWERLKLIVEPSGAVPFAALLKGQKNFKGKNVGVIISGGNVDLLKMLNLFEKLKS